MPIRNSLLHVLMDKTWNLSCFQVGLELQEIGLPKVEGTKTLANNVIAVVSNLDSQQIEEQVKSLLKLLQKLPSNDVRMFR